jgi:uncharacterized repeat protein (TIGR01451 family)
VTWQPSGSSIWVEGHALIRNVGFSMISLTRPFGRNVFGLSVLGLALSCSACATVPQTVRMNSSDKGPVQAIYKESDKSNSKELFGAKTAKKSHESDIQQLSYAPSEAGVSEAGVTRVQKTSDVLQANYSEVGNSDNRVQQTQWNAPANCDVNPRETNPNACQIECCPPDPRWPAAGQNPMGPGLMACDICNLPSPETYADEYLCDGGDREIPVHYDSRNRRGLDTEDTILEFTDVRGNERMKPSNKVCIYAPRFATVRTVSRPHEESMTNEVAGLGQLAAMGGIQTRLKASANVKREMTGRIAVRSRASGLETDAYQGEVSQLRSPSIHDKLLNIYQSLNFVRFGRIDDADSARLNYGIQAAFLWTREENPVISSKTDMALEGHFEEASATITAIDEKDEKENLRIIKLADKKSAVPGDDIEFTIRYDNLGGREVHHIRIVDNLTPRLQYLDDTATSDRAGRLVLQDNGEGSQILIWELDEPLPGKTGGVITFKSRVR